MTLKLLMCTSEAKTILSQTYCQGVTAENILNLQSHIPDPLWINVSNDVLDLDNDI